MAKINKEEAKNQFVKSFKGFANSLQNALVWEDGQWAVKGFIDVAKQVYSISSDTKVVSKVLEIQLFPILSSFADSIGYELEQADKQNYYPDFTFKHKDDSSVLFAVDIKSTYRRENKGVSHLGFTLGSHGSYFINREGTKNIQYPYSKYAGHFCLAVVYTQKEEIDEKQKTDISKLNIYKLKELGEPEITQEGNAAEDMERLIDIPSVIKDIKVYFVEKWKIASDAQGSGNTANIGSIKNEEDLANENGVFSRLGESYFDCYWINYNKASLTVGKDKIRKITNIWDYLAFRNEIDKFVLVGKGAKKKPKEYTKKTKKDNKPKKISK